MSLSYYFSFSAPETTSAVELERFFRVLEKEAMSLGFTPTLVLNANFDTNERRQFARQLTHGLVIENAGLKDVGPIRNEQVFEHDATYGLCRIIPKEGVFLVVTDESAAETVFGLFRYPEFLEDQHGNRVFETNCGKKWVFNGFVDTPDPRFRTLVRKIAEAGYLQSSKDEFSPVSKSTNEPKL